MLNSPRIVLCLSFLLTFGVAQSFQNILTRRPPPTAASQSSSSLKMSSSAKKKLYSFKEARRIARGHGFSSKEEFIEYSCPGAYQLPKNPHEVWKAEFTTWEDWLGICYTFEEGKEIAQKLGISSKEGYLELFEKKLIDDDDDAIRLPYRPDLMYKAEWQGWSDWLGA